jgi:tetratricopeptide (TPR) repeat protein
MGSAPVDLAQRSRPEAWAASIHTAIGQRRMLLVFDDVWDIADALALRIGGSQCAHLITTRFPEIARRFAADGALVVRELENTEGRLLLMRLAPDVIQTEPQEAQALVAAVGGLPLALTLLGHFLRAQAHSGQPRRIRAALERLRHADERLRLSEPQTLIGNHPSLEIGTSLSLQAAIGLSDQQVSSEARATLRALAIFPPKPNTFAEEAAVEISGLPVETLDALSDAGLLESSGPARYTLHQTIADYASADQRDPRVVQRFALYFVAYAGKHATDYATLDLESYNILAALEAAHEQSMHAALIEGVHALAPFLITRGLYTVAETQLQRSLAAARALTDGKGQVAALLHLGRIAEQRSNYEQARQIWQDALTLARQYGDTSSRAHALRELGELARIHGQPEQARQFLTEALEALNRPADRQIRAGTLRLLGNLTGEQGQAEQARELYLQALDLSRSLGDRRGMAMTLGSLGVQAREQGLPARAREFYEEALAIFRELGDNSSASTILMNLGNLARHEGHVGEAQALYKEALALSRKVENRRIANFVLLNLASLSGDQGQFDAALQIINEILSVFREFGDLRNMALAYQAQGDIERDAGYLAPAREHLEQSLALFRELREQRQTALSTRSLGILARQEMRLDEAHALLQEALSLLQQVDDQREVAQTRQELSTLARLEGHFAEARALGLEALSVMRQMRDRRYAAHALGELGHLALQSNQSTDALRSLLSAAVGMRLINSFELPKIEELIAFVRAQLGEESFLEVARHLARSTPELAYGLSQATWRSSIQFLTTHTHADSI